ncbi:MAG: hypothetical protein WCP73_08490 [Eubacteriales bacterium]
MFCPAIAKETVCLEAQVKVAPEVKIGKACIVCKGCPFIGRCPGTPQQSCSFFVSQRIHIEVPLAFGACVSACPSGIVCGEPKVFECKEEKDDMAPEYDDGDDDGFECCR